MKDTIRKTFVFTLMTLFTMSLFAEPTGPMKGCSHSEFGDYSIQISNEPIVLKKKEIVTYDLKYENLKQVIKIGIEETSRCRNFIVRYPNFEVQYVCSKMGFGVKRINPGYSTINPEMVSSLMDETQFNYQQKIMDGEDKNNEDLLQIIACFFPKLIDEEVRKMAGTL